MKQEWLGIIMKRPVFPFNIILKKYISFFVVEEHTILRSW